MLKRIIVRLLKNNQQKISKIENKENLIKKYK